MLQLPKNAMAPGDRAPNFLLPDQSGKVTMFYDQVTGRPVVLLFAGEFYPPLLPPALLAFETMADDYAAAGVDVFCICQAKPDAVQTISPRMKLWSDPEKKITNAFMEQIGLKDAKALKGGKIVALLLDANQRLLKTMTRTTDSLPSDILGVYAKIPNPGEGQVRRATAPVLIIPDLLDPTMSQALISMFKTGNAKEGVVGSVMAGSEVNRVHHDRKKRLDFPIEDPKMHQILQTVIGRRIVPELAKSANFQGFKFDRFLVCRYAADREDRFRTHRDNLSPETADRRFAMTLNLNGDEYEGGELVFPEYGPDRYKPGNGGAVVFSCSLLHEALPVTKGERFALLTFLRSPNQQPQQARGPVRR